MRYSICMIPKIKENLSSYKPSGPIVGLPQAAVLILLHETSEDLNLIYCLRSNNLPTHAGEVAFPGGKREEKDETLRETALREAQEEVNLELKDVEVLGEISSVQSRFGLSVTPYIGILKSNTLIADGKEIAEVFSVPLNFIKNNMQKEQKSENWDNKKVFFPFFEFENKMVWGLTAYMTVEFLKLLDIEIDLTRK
jgi:8-oxo-dGTP pyrophosphatase MutT (NUDIX family)